MCIEMNKNKNIPIITVGLRFSAGLVGLAFLFMGMGFLAFPEVLATAFFAEPSRAVGVNSIRGDFGALFLGMGLFCLLGSMTTRRSLLFVPIIFLVLIIAGRLTGLIVDGLPNVVSGFIAVELLSLLILILCVNMSPAGKDPNQSSFTLKEILNVRTAAALSLILIIFFGMFLFRREIGMALFKAGVAQFASRDLINELPDGLHVGLCGTGSPLTDSKRACVSLFVIAGKSLYIVDAGPGSGRKFDLMKLRPGDVTSILLTHFHSDHIGELGEWMLKRWAAGSRKAPLPVYGPPGVETVVQGFNLAYSLDSQYRIAHHGTEAAPPSGSGGIARPFDFPKGKDEAVVIRDKDLKVTAFSVDHSPVEPAVGYRFDYKGRSVVISGDTAPCENVRRHAAGADLLLHEALQPNMVRVIGSVNRKAGYTSIAKFSKDIPDYHTSPEDAARIAHDAGVDRLVLYHVVPPLPVAILNKSFLGDAEKYYQGPMTIGVDGLFFSMPAESTEILEKWIL